MAQQLGKAPNWIPLFYNLLVGGVDGRYRWAGRNLNGVSQCTISYGASKDNILVNTVQLKPMIKAHSSGRMMSSGITDVVITSVNSEKTPEEVGDDEAIDYYYYNRKTIY